MRIFLFFLFVGYVARCDDSNYYVVEVPEEESVRTTKKLLRVYWNVPTMQCKSKKIPFENLFEKYGILQNKNDTFKGEKITILYDPGVFPALLKNDSSGAIRHRNGGVPQAGDIEEHLRSFKEELDKSIPNPDFSGLGIIDFESWRPVFRQNFGVLQPYKDTSFEIERKLHWWWPEQWIKSEAKRRFEASAREFMQTTLSVAKQLRPNAMWGYYAFPYCFNMAKNGLHESCADGVPNENDRLYWLWSESSALYPSIYSSKDLSTSQLAAMVRGRMSEATRVRRNKSFVLPYFWFRYREGGYLREVDLKAVLHTLYNSAATGFVIWGSSNDVNTKEKCIKLQNYLDKTLGPNIAKYTKTNTIYRDGDYITEDDLKDSTTTEKNNNDIELDPEYHWVPPENYTNNIKENVEEEIRKKNITLDNKLSMDDKQNDSALISLIVNSIRNENASDVDDNENHISTDSSHRTKYSSKNSKKGYPITDHGIEGFVYTTKGPYSFNDELTSTTISTTKDYLNLSVSGTSTEFINSSNFVDNGLNIADPTVDKTESPKYTITTTEAPTVRTASLNFDNDAKTEANSDLVKNERSKSIQETTESATDSTENFTTEYNQTVPIEDVTENEVTPIHFFNHDTFLKNFNDIDTTVSALDLTTDKGSNEKDLIKYEDFEVINSTTNDVNFSIDNDITDCVDCTTENGSKIYNFSQSNGGNFEDSSLPNQVVVI